MNTTCRRSPLNRPLVSDATDTFIPPSPGVLSYSAWPSSAPQRNTFLYVSALDDMQPLIDAMMGVREAFYSALVRSLLRTKSLLQTILNIWISPSVINGENGSATLVPNGETSENGHRTMKRKTSVEEFLATVAREMKGNVTGGKLSDLSDGLKVQMKDSLKDNPLCMLPSYNHQLPSGDERGTYLALDVGGSTFRVALIELSGRQSREQSKILTIRSFKINAPVKQLKGLLFFDWMAQRISETLSGQAEGHNMTESPLSMGLAWSFPIEQTSLRSGLLQGMGKGFLAAHGLIGQDLGDLIQGACFRHGLNVQMNAIVNDSSATLLSKAYLDSTTRFALILGTGVNAAVHLPVNIFSPVKFGARPAEWHDEAKHVIVNTELSMFGGGLLPLTKWDETLNRYHSMPEFQPLEHMVSGGYLGEVARLILVDGIKTAGLFGGVVPDTLTERYSLDTEVISRIEADNSSTLTAATEMFCARHPTPTPPTYADMVALRTIASHVSYRGSALVATGVHALWQLRNDAESIQAKDSKHTLVAYNGSVMENYPQFKQNCQKHLDGLVEGSGGAESGILELVYAEESSLLGAAVAVACMEG